MTNFMLTNLAESKTIMEDMSNIIAAQPEPSRYNFAQPPKGNNTAKLRKLTQYRKWRHMEERLKGQIAHMTKLIAQLPDDRETPFCHRGKTLPQLWVELAEIQLRLREAEDIANSLPSLYLEIAQSRYFDSHRKRPPEWSETVREFGLPITAAELRSRFSAQL